jgi:hypothetical protein
MIGANAGKFEAMIKDLAARGLDSVMINNSFANLDAPLLDTSDNLDFSVFVLPGGDLSDDWWPFEVPANAETARRVAEPIVQQFAPHPSFKGYIVKDEPGLHELSKVALITQAFQELDPGRPATPILIGVDRAGPIFNAAQPDVMLIDVYPVGSDNPLCDFTMTGFGYGNLDFVGYIRQVTQNKPAHIPLWIILQTHRFGDGGLYSLREPVPAEVRAQQWLAIGEGATGIFWFIYGSQQGWTGLVDNPALYPEVTQLAQRVGPLRSLLLGLQKVEDRFTITGAENPYVSTLASKDGQKFYVVAVNRDCEATQMLSISSSMLNGRLRDVESSQIYEMEEPILFRPGDGRIFELASLGCSDDSAAVDSSHSSGRCLYLPAVLR